MEAIIGIIVALLLVGLSTAFFFLSRKHSRVSRVLFVGPRGSGKTEAIARLLNKPNETLPTLGTHKYRYNGVEIEEVPPVKSPEFFHSFGFGVDARNIFFVRNIQEVQDYPDVDGLDVTYVLWKRQAPPAEKIPNIVLLDESSAKLAALLC